VNPHGRCHNRASKLHGFWALDCEKHTPGASQWVGASLEPNARVDRPRSRRKAGGDVGIGMNGRSEGKWRLRGPGSNAGLDEALRAEEISTHLCI
jgi:hypothetical protein